MKDMGKKEKRLLISLGLIFTFLAYSVYDIDYGILFDNYILDKLHRQTDESVLIFSKAISFLGSAYIIAGLILVLFIHNYRKKNYYAIKLLVANSIFSYLVNFILKQLIHRTRPLAYFRIDYSGYSFPSGHSMINMSLWMAIAYLMTRDKENKALVYTLVSAYIGAMGLSRIYLGVHWPTDVLAGFIMGYIVYRISRDKILEN